MGVDFAQNMDVPHFGEEQPADIYYFSPLTVNVFGCTDLTSKPTQMQASYEGTSGLWLVEKGHNR